MRCLYTNADSLHNKLTELEIYVMKENIDIIAITESLCKNPAKDYDPVFIISGFECIMNNAGRGTLLFLRNGLEYVTLSQYEDLFSPCTICKIKLNKENDLIFGVIYRSPNSTEEGALNMNKLISRISERFNGNSILLVGDFNYRDIDWKKDMSNTNDSHVASKFLDCVHENFLYQLVEEPTHQRGSQTPSLIDLILTNRDDLVDDIIFHPPLGKSHHSVLCFDLNVCIKNDVKENVEKYRLDKGDYDGMRKYVSKIDWKGKLKEDDSLNDWSETLVSTLEEAKIKFVPKKMF